MAPHAAPPAAPKWTAERVLRAATGLYGASGDAAERRRADKELSAFQHSDAAVQLSLALLQDRGSWEPALGGSGVGGAAALLLAQTVQRRLQKAATFRGAAPQPEDLLRLAEASFARGDARVAQALARGVAVLWLRSGTPPVDQVLATLRSAGGTPGGAAALAALGAIPEEAGSKEVLGQERASVVRQLATAAGAVLATLGGLTEVPASPRLAAAAAWFGAADAAEALPQLGASPLVPLALQTAAAGGEGRGDDTAACDFLDVLLKQSAASPQALLPLLDVLLGLLAAARPATDAARHAVAKFVADAVGAWSWLFMQAGASPVPQWQQLLEVLLSCAAWGFEPAAVTLPAWLSLHTSASNAGLSSLYAPVFTGAVRALRRAAQFPAGYEAWSLEAHDAFRDFRDELRDLLRRLIDGQALPGFVAEVCGEAAAGSTTAWQPHEEALHALSAVAAAVCKAVPSAAAAARAPLGPGPVLEALGSLGALAGGASEALAGHRQLLCTFLVCASVYVPVLALPHRIPGIAPGSESALGRVLELARLSLSVPQEVAEGPDAAFPFRAKQDHAGAVCILKFCMGCGAEIANGSSEVFQALRKDHRTQLETLARKAPTALRPQSVLVLTQSLSLVALHNGQLTHDLLTDCLAALSATQGEAALLSCAEALQRCRGQQEALGGALEASWPALAEASRGAEAAPLARLLAAAAEAAPAASLRALSGLLAGAFEQRPEARLALFDPVVAMAHRVKSEPAATPLLGELLLGVGRLAAAELGADAVEARLLLAADTAVRRPGEADCCELSPRERALLEAWARCTLEVGRHAAACLGDEAARLALRGAAAALAVPHGEPPVRVLGLLAEAWSDEALRQRWRAALEAEALPGGGWPVGALVLRGLFKALLGQMPITAMGVLAPTARAVHQLGGPSFAGWAAKAVGGEGFPSASTRAEAKQRFVKELSAADPSTTHFKQLLKRFCSAKQGQT